jgi:hypothetical protein
MAMSLNDLNRWKSPEEAEAERKAKATFWPRVGLIGVLSLVGAFVVCGVFGMQGGFWAVFGLIAVVLGICLLQKG